MLMWRIHSLWGKQTSHWLHQPYCRLVHMGPCPGRRGLGVLPVGKWEAYQHGGIRVYSIWSNFRWLKHKFEVLTRTMFDAGQTSCFPNPPNLRTITGVGRAWPAFPAVANFRPAWAKRLCFCISKYCGCKKSTQQSKMHHLIMHTPTLTRPSSRKAKPLTYTVPLMLTGWHSGWRWSPVWIEQVEI